VYRQEDKSRVVGATVLRSLVSLAGRLTFLVLLCQFCVGGFATNNRCYAAAEVSLPERQSVILCAALQILWHASRYRSSKHQGVRETEDVAT
jgi:hypothetical protein